MLRIREYPENLKILEILEILVQTITLQSSCQAWPGRYLGRPEQRVRIESTPGFRGDCMLETERTSALFAEAHTIYAEGLKYLDEAIELWDRELLRKSAGKTWAAALQATNALILARTGAEAQPDDDDWTYDWLIRLTQKVQDLKLLKGRYAILSHDIYQTAVCERNVEPVYLLIRDIRKTADYIRDAERLASEGD